MPTAYRDVALLLRRAGFGGTQADINALTQFDLATVVAKVLDTTQVPPVVVPPVVMDTTADWYTIYVAFIEWWFDRMATTPNPLAEKMTLFWHSHFTSALTKTDFVNMWNQINTYRSLGMGSFRDLTQAAAISPAMLQWLDGETNVKGAPNENFARECMELFTIGVNQYTQADVTAAAAAWTGHGLSTDKHTYVFTAAKHDTTNKTIFGITKNWNGPDVVDELTLGSKQNTCARFIATKLWAWFAYDRPETAVVDTLSAAFIASNMNITELLRAIFTHPNFYADASRHGHVRSPAEYLVATMRYVNLPAATMHPEWYLSSQGQYLLEPPNVAGWKDNAYWVSTSTMWNRANAARNVCWGASSAGFLGGTSALSIQTAAQHVFDAFGIDEPSQATRTNIENNIYAERAARGWAENVNLIQLGLLCPEFQAG